MSASSSRRPETRSLTRQILIERRKRSVQHRYVHQLYTYPLSTKFDQFPDDSCPKCDPIDEDIEDRNFNRFALKIKRFDPDITLSGANQNSF